MKRRNEEKEEKETRGHPQGLMKRWRKLKRGRKTPSVTCEWTRVRNAVMVKEDIFYKRILEYGLDSPAIDTDHLHVVLAV